MELCIMGPQTLLKNKRRQDQENKEDMTKKQREDKPGKVKGDRTEDNNKNRIMNTKLE